MMQKRVVLELIGLLVVAGCAGVSPVQVGQTAGSIAGAVLVPGLGMPIGTIAGTLAGLVIEGQLDKVREKKERVDLAKQLQSSPPAAPAAVPSERPLGHPARVWVDEQLQQGRLIAGHFESRVIP